MRILLVDDEVRVLEGLERMLLQIVDDDWEIVTADGGLAALASLAERPCDVVISDMRMPGMDGAELLRRVQASHPDVIRIILSGHMDEEAAVRALPHAHQFLSKPCSGEGIHAVVLRAQELREMLSAEVIRRAVGTLDALPAVPAVYAELVGALGSEGAGAAVVAEIIGRDPALSAKVLQLVSSAYFRRGAPIASIERAVSVLGLRVIEAFVLSVSAFGSASHARFPRGLDLEQVQQRSLRSATIARRLGDALVTAKPSARASLSRPTGHDAFLAALVADVGLLVLASTTPEALAIAVDLAEREQRPLHEVEREVYGTTHACVGAYLLGVWGLPFAVVEAVARHHEPLADDGASPPLVATTHVAVQLVDGTPLDPGSLACFAHVDLGALTKSL
jgi:HD-like signal output (HDOD) protein